jgi:hypothetical protein
MSDPSICNRDGCAAGVRRKRSYRNNDGNLGRQVRITPKIVLALTFALPAIGTRADMADPVSALNDAYASLVESKLPETPAELVQMFGPCLPSGERDRWNVERGWRAFICSLDSGLLKRVELTSPVLNSRPYVRLLPKDCISIDVFKDAVSARWAIQSIYPLPTPTIPMAPGRWHYYGGVDAQRRFAAIVTNASGVPVQLELDGIGSCVASVGALHPAK